MEEDFEFKPLTQGLGFHKKTIDLSNELKKTTAASQITSPKNIPPVPTAQYKAPDIESMKKSMDKFPSYDSPTVTQPLPRQTTEPVAAFKSPRISARFDEPVYVPNTQPKIEPRIDAGVDFAAIKKSLPVANKISVEPMSPALAEAPFSIGAFIFDIFMVAGLTCLFTGVVLAITQSDLTLVLENAKVDTPTRISIGVLALAVIQLYMILARSFFGKTLGEWAFDIQLGNSQQQKSAWYPLQVALRAFVITITGFVTLPLLSLITRRDIAAYLCGVRKYRHE